MVRHVATSVFLAALVTGAIFLVMLSLVWQGRAALDARKSRTVIEYVRIRRDSDVEVKSRERPKKVELPEAPAVPELRPSAVAAPTDVAVPADVPLFRPSFSLGGSPRSGMSTGPDMDAVPLVRVNPLYPARAQARGVEGWVHLRFTVGPDGTTSDVEVIASEPKGYFERAAQDAVRKYKYKPRIENGVPVARPGVEIVVSFELDG